VAFVGAGAAAREHVRAFRDVDNVDITGICSRTRARAQTLATDEGIPRVCDSIAELYAETQADLVVVAVPELAAARVATECFRFTWAALLEKPAGYCFDDAERIVQAAHARRRRAFVALNRRFFSSTGAALADLTSDTAPRFIHILDQQSLSDARALGQPDTVVEHWMYANSIHVIDFLTLFGRGAVTSVEPVVAWEPAAPSVVLATVRFSSGDIGLYEGHWGGPAPWAVAVSTASRRWELRPLEAATVQRAGERHRTPVEPHQWDTDFKTGFRRQAQAAVDAVRGRPSEIPTLAESLTTMRLISAIFRPRSSREQAA
jgi:predicted dehydrogenase